MMLDLPANTRATKRAQAAPGVVLPAELDFYEAYGWCLNPHLLVGEAMNHLAAEVARFEAVPEGWQTGEVAANVYLLACGILNCTDEYLRGPSLRLPGRLGKTTLARGGGRLIEATSALSWRRLRQVRNWREQWVDALNGFLRTFIAAEAAGRTGLAEDSASLARLAQVSLPADLGGRYLNVPSPFRRLDMSHHDVLAMGRLLIERLPDRARPVVLVGLRTSGSYFTPLIRAQLEAEGYDAVSVLTIEPNKGAGRAERRALERHAGEGGIAVVVDDPPDTGGTVYAALSIARRAGFAEDRLRVLVPAHPSRRRPMAEAREGLVIVLDPERWHKRRMLEPGRVSARLNDYFAAQGLTVTRVTASGSAKAINDRLDAASLSGRGSHLKRVFEVRLEARDGSASARLILAKSTGWGWLGYHGFLAGQRLAGHVPPLLGLRDGLVYMEWVTQPAARVPERDDREARIAAAASYVAARTRSLRLTTLSEAGMDLNRQNNGIRLVEKALSRAYGRFLVDTLRRPRLSALLRRQPSPLPTFIDGNMRSSEWVTGEDGLLKTDYEHHGMGKAGLNVTDPAFDLADAMLDLGLDREEAGVLVRRYREASGDETVEARLFLNKLLAGIWNLNQAQEEIVAARGDATAQQRAHERFMRAWAFLTVETAFHCGAPFAARKTPAWTAPLVALDIDGVIDLRRFGYPCTTAAGMEALSLFKAHGVSVAVNTARSLPEVKAYCAAYGLSGGIAEYGACLWDAVAGKSEALISDETLTQLESLRRHLRQLPGVFLDERHRYSVRAFTYRDKPDGLLSSLVRSMKASPVGDGAVAPLPGLVIERVMAELGLDRLSYHHTVIDTTIIAREADKGSGLAALRDRVLEPGAETIAVGDSKPDLAMFRIASRSYAPANISCGAQARDLGCRIVAEPFQSGLLAIARTITGDSGASMQVPEGDLFFDLLRIADSSQWRKLVVALFDPRAYRIFLR